MGKVGDLLVDISDAEMSAGGSVGIVGSSLLVLDEVGNDDDDNNDENDLKNYSDKNDRVEFVDSEGEPVDEAIVHIIILLEMLICLSTRNQDKSLHPLVGM